MVDVDFLDKILRKMSLILSLLLLRKRMGGQKSRCYCLLC